MCQSLSAVMCGKCTATITHCLLQCRYLLSPACPDTYQIKQLLRWFREACREESDEFPKGDTRCVALIMCNIMPSRLRMHKQRHVKAVGVSDCFLQTHTYTVCQPGIMLCCAVLLVHAVLLSQHAFGLMH